jgi:GPH family glycoside/pentoside/hexuronide:cation symporter/probable glucitol transport protein GutA
MASAMFASRFIVAITAPAVGMLSDRQRAKGGTRRPWVAVALLGLTGSGVRLLVPPHNITPEYYLWWITLLGISQAMFDIPHLAWGVELARSYNDSTRLFTIRSLTSAIGVVAFYAIPLIPIFDTRAITPETLKCAAFLITIYMVLAMYFTIRRIPDGEYKSSARTDSLIATLHIILSNKPFLIVASIGVFLGIGEGMWLSLSFVVYDFYYGIGKEISALYLLSYAITAISLPFLQMLAAKRGKKLTFAFLQIAFILLITLRLFIVPSPQSYAPLFLILLGVNVILICNFVISSALLADCITYGQWKYGSGHSGCYFAVNSFFANIAGGIGAPLGLAIIGSFGFSPKGIANMAVARTGMDLAFFLIPASMSSIALLFIAKIPICAHRAAIIRRRLDMPHRSRVEPLNRQFP